MAVSICASPNSSDRNGAFVLAVDSKSGLSPETPRGPKPAAAEPVNVVSPYEIEPPKTSKATGGRKPKRRREESGGEDEPGKRLVYPDTKPTASGVPNGDAGGGVASAAGTAGTAGTSASSSAIAPSTVSGPAQSSDVTADEPASKRARSGGQAEKLLQNQIQEQRRILTTVLRQSAMAERREERSKLCRETQRLGRFRYGLVGRADRDTSVQWEGGTECEALETARGRLSELKQVVDRNKKALSKPKSLVPEGTTWTEEELEEQTWELKELNTCKSTAASREEEDLKKREHRLNVERVEYLQRLRIVEAEDKLDFGSLPMYKHKYQLLRLMDRGGGHWAYKAIDTLTGQFCMVMVYQLGEHAGIAAIVRECEAAKLLKHPSIPQLFDHFEVMGQNGFKNYALVWEHPQADSLESWLRRHGLQPQPSEKEARGVLLQLFSILRFFEAKSHPLASQDLHSSRLLLRGGEILLQSLLLPSLKPAASRPLEGARVETVDSCGSLFAPESLDDSMAPDGYSSALYAIGMLLHEILYGRRPESAANTSALGTGPSPVQLPEQPKISAECREFLLRLLDREQRPTLQDAFSDTFLSTKKR